jgi:hypothetical protein
MARPTSSRNARAARAVRATGEGAFQAFFERDALREKRRRSRRKTLIVSLAIHALAILVLVVYSVWQVDELWTPSVPVKVYSRKAAPPEVLVPSKREAAIVDPFAPPPR